VSGLKTEVRGSGSAAHTGELYRKFERGERCLLVKYEPEQLKDQCVDQKSHLGWGFLGVFYLEIKLSSSQNTTKNCYNWVYAVI
jgi:hypothetical protein